jgi:outer membrane immunogenic protein
MKKLLLASVGVLALGVAAASAADIVRARRAPSPAPVYVTPAFSWTGFYAGINGGYGWGGSTSFSAPFASTSFDTSGGLVGGTLGYNYQMNQIVFGVEGDIDASWIKGSSICGGLTCETKNSWLGTARGRVGYAFDRFMPYVTGGAAFGDVKNTITPIGSASQTRAGWTVGGGLEANLYGPWSAKVEYLYVDLGSGAPVAGSSADFKSNIVRAGLNYHF